MHVDGAHMSPSSSARREGERELREDEKEMKWFGSTPETITLSLFFLSLKRAREKTLVRRTADKAAARLG